MNQNAVIIASRRTPIAAINQQLRNQTVVDLGIKAGLATITSPALPKAITQQIDQACVGNCFGPGGNIARIIWQGITDQAAGASQALNLNAGAQTIDNQCASGLSAIRLAAWAIKAQATRAALAGGAESATTRPLRARKAPPANNPGGARNDLPPEFYDQAPMAYWPDKDLPVLESAQLLAQHLGVGRKQIDDYAYRAHAQANAGVAAMDTQRNHGGIVSISGVHVDSHPRKISRSTLQRLKPARDFAPEMTAGNTAPLADGAAMTLVVGKDLAQQHGLGGLEVIDTVSLSCDPLLPGRGSGYAIKELLARNGLQVADVSRFEIVQAFAVQMLDTFAQLGLEPGSLLLQRFNPDGGTLGWGHPWGASGAIVVNQMFWHLPQLGSLGVCAAAVAGGGGEAMLLRRI